MAKAEVGELREAVSAMAQFGMKRAAANKGKKAFKNLSERKNSSKGSLGRSSGSTLTTASQSLSADSLSSGSLGKGQKAAMQ